MTDNDSKSSNIGLEIRFDATAQSPRFTAQEVADAVGAYMTHFLSVENVTVKVNGAWLNFSKAYQREAAEAEARKAQRTPFGAKDGWN